MGEFEGELDGSHLTFKHSPGMRLRLAPPPCASGRVRVLLRPEAVTVHPAPREGAFEARAVHSAYSGGSYQYWLEVSGQRLLARHHERLGPGETVWLSLEARHLLVFPAQGEVGVRLPAAPPDRTSPHSL